MAEPEEFPQPPAALKARVTASLRANSVLHRRRHWSRIPLAIAAGVALFVAGTQVARLSPVAASEQPAFALLLYEDAAFRPTVAIEQIVQEYTAWAEAVAERGDLVLAEEFDPVVQVAGPAGTDAPGPLGQLTGMFVVHAPDRAAALELARNHPHLVHGGRIVVRGFVRRG
jgi:hypothetical protein